MLMNKCSHFSERVRSWTTTEQRSYHLEGQSVRDTPSCHVDEVSVSLISSPASLLLLAQRLADDAADAHETDLLSKRKLTLET